jgi:hypothetical protein
MIIKQFTYTKASGEVSERVVLQLVSPAKNMSGIDISALSEEDQARFAGAWNALLDDYRAETDMLLDEYDLNHGYRQFDPAKMSNITSESI